MSWVGGAGGGGSLKGGGDSVVVTMVWYPMSMEFGLSLSKVGGAWGEVMLMKGLLGGILGGLWLSWWFEQEFCLEWRGEVVDVGKYWLNSAEVDELWRPWWQDWSGNEKWKIHHFSTSFVFQKLTVKGCPEQTEGCLESPKGDLEVQLEDKELVDPL